MTKARKPVIFVGHGSPMIALEDTDLTRSFKEVGEEIVYKSNPQAILSISAHWYRGKNKIQSSENPKQIYDFRGFPKELSEIEYRPKGCMDLTESLLEIFGDNVEVDNEWGIDHGTWTVLKHMIPKADIPVVQLSVNMLYSLEEMYNFAKKLRLLRDKYLILGTGNIVHNLWKADWENPGGTRQRDSFDNYIEKIIMDGNYEEIINVEDHKDYKYAVPQNDHFAPLVYALAAADGDRAKRFNKAYQLGSVSMTSYIFG